MKTKNSAMYLIYRDSDGTEHAEAWQDVVDSGTLVSPETGEDMTIVGWATD